MRSICFIIIIAFFFSCDTNLQLSDEERDWINVFNGADLLIFKSSDNRVDSIRLNGTKVWTENRDSFSSSYNPQCGQVLADNDYLIKVCKMYPDKTTYFLNFKNEFLSFSPGILKNKSINFNNSKIACSEIIYEDSNTTLKTLYWNKNIGIVKYIERTGVEWELIKK